MRTLFNPEKIDVERAVKTAVSRVIAEARSTAEYEGGHEGLEITDVTNCGEAV